MEPYRHEALMMEDYNILNDIIDNMMEAYEELDGAKKYIKTAMKYRSTDRKMADRLVVMSAEELGHADSICEGIEAMLTKAEGEDDDCAFVLRKVWSHLKERMNGYKAWIKNMHAEYKSMA